jgi:hypothetical protein
MGRSFTAWLLVAVMAIGSILMWLGVPAFWIWLASQLADSSQPSMGLYLMLLVGIIASMFAVGKGLGMLNHAHAHLTDTLPEKREQTVWMRSMRGEREYTRNSGVLGTVMVISVTLALLCLGVWFFFYAKGGGI